MRCLTVTKSVASYIHMLRGLLSQPLLTMKDHCLAGQGIASEQRTPCQHLGVILPRVLAVGIESPEKHSCWNV